MKEQILALREQGFTYNQIKAELGCSKSTISYYCSPDQKAKTQARTAKSREQTALSKFEAFKYNSKGVNNKFTQFKGRGKLDYAYTYQNIIGILATVTACYLCNTDIDYQDPSSFHFDHKVPVSRGGTNELENLGIACSVCNYAKRDMLVDEFLAMCERITKFNAR